MKKNHGLIGAALSISLLIIPTTNAHAKDIGWGIPKKSENEIQPYPGAEYDYIINENDAFYIGDAEDNHIYLTFDCGYENGNLPMILDALKKEGVPALFFLTGHFMEEEPELVRRMANEGHLVGNHTYDHPNLTTISKERFMSELLRAEEKYEEITGKQMSKYLRPPEGKFNQQVLDWSKEAGYYNVFWSLAYVDWYVDKQKGPEHAKREVMARVHPGAIILLHSTSSDNAQAMETLLPALKDEGYEFKSLNHLLTSQLEIPIE